MVPDKLDNAKMRCREKDRRILKGKDDSEGGDQPDSDSDNLPECNRKSINLTKFSIVGSSRSGTRKRPRSRRTGCWWTAAEWSPGYRRRLPWRLGRRLKQKESIVEAEDGQTMQMDEVGDRVLMAIEQSRGKETEFGTTGGHHR